MIAAVEAKSKLVLNLKVTLNNSGLLILCIFIQAHNKVRKLQKKKKKRKKKKLTHHTSATKTMFLNFLVHYVNIFEMLLMFLSTIHELGILSIA